MMLVRRRGIATAVVAAIIIVVIGVSGAAVAYSATHVSTTTATSTATSTVTQAPVTTTSVVTNIETSVSTILSTATSTVTGPTQTVTSTSVSAGPTTTLTKTSTVTGPTTTVTSTQTSTETQTQTETQTSTVTQTVTSGQSSSSSSSSTTSSSSSGSTSTSSCSTATTTETNSTQETGQLFVGLVQAFPTMSVEFGDNTSQGPEVIDSSYAVLYAPSGAGSTYKVNITESVEGFSESATMWIMTDGNVVAVDSGGQNVTGSSASLDVIILTAPFIVIEAYGQVPSSLVPTGQIEATGQSTVNLGGFSMTVTEYQAESLPVTYSDCLGDTITLNTFVLKVGTAPGTSFSLLTYLDMQGTELSGGLSENYSIYIQVTAATEA